MISDPTGLATSKDFEELSPRVLENTQELNFILEKTSPNSRYQLPRLEELYNTEDIVHSYLETNHIDAYIFNYNSWIPTEDEMDRDQTWKDNKSRAYVFTSEGIFTFLNTTVHNFENNIDFQRD
jgi:hypothetical protein